MSVATLHPAARRRLAERMPAVHGHTVRLRALGGADPIVAGSELTFLDTILDELGRDDWREQMGARRQIRRGTDGVFELSQPVHRRFHVALFEASCDQPGSPRLDPRRLAGMGMVLRRWSDGTAQGWMVDGARRPGWTRLTHPKDDPDRALRPDLAGTTPAIRALLAARRPEATACEEVLPLFVAPEALCKARRRTILYGLIPTASAERSAAAPPVPDYAGEREAMLGHFSSFLGRRAATPLPRAGQRLDKDWNLLSIDADAGGETGQLRSFGLFLQQLLVELDAFGPGPAARELIRLYETVSLPLADGSVDAGEFCDAAARILILGEDNAGGIVMPQSWPAMEAVGDRIADAALACLTERHRAVLADSPKFGDDADQYRIRAFVRAVVGPGCSPQIVWSDDSEPFRILPWWDGDGPVAQIKLPDLANLKRIKPSVSFAMPPALADLLNGDMKKLKDGEKSGGPAMGIYWLCSFSIPAITICAFIVLNIFLSLFNIIFSWLAFIKLCIPIPRPK